MDEVSGPRSSGKEHSGSVNQAVWFSLANGASESASETIERWRVFNTDPRISTLTAPSNQARLVSSPLLTHLTPFPLPSPGLCTWWATFLECPPSRDETNPSEFGTHLNFHPSCESFPENHSAVKAFFLSFNLLYKLILHSFIQQIIFKKVILKASWPHDPFTLLTMIEGPKEFWFTWVITIDFYHISIETEKCFKYLLIYVKRTITNPLHVHIRGMTSSHVM